MYDELDLTASASITINKFVAKIASDMLKRGGLTFMKLFDIGFKKYYLILGTYMYVMYHQQDITLHKTRTGHLWDEPIWNWG